MVFILVKLSLFLLVIISFGYVVSFLFLKNREISILVPFSILTGLVGYMFLVNAVSYLVFIKNAIWLVLIFFCLFVTYQIYTKGIETFKPEMNFTRKELKILFVLAILLSMTSGVVALRALDTDDYSHLIFAATISEGNFPVMNPMDPDTTLSYHYGPDLLAGAMRNVTGAPLLQDFVVQTFAFSGLTFLLAFLLAFYISRSYYASIIVALFFFFGAGMLFLNVFGGFSPLYHKYILHETVVGPWKFVADIIWPKINHYYTYAIRNHTSAMGTPIMLAIIYLYFRYLDGAKVGIRDGVFAGLFLGALALSLETSFVILSFVLGLTLLWKAFQLTVSKDTVLREKSIGGAKFVITTLLVGSTIALLQGGIISASLKYSSNASEGQTFAASGEQHFAFNRNPSELIVSYASEERVSILSFTFLKEFGLLLLLFPLAVFVFRRDKKILFLSSIGIVAFFVPIFIIYVSRPWELTRIFSVATPIFSFVSAILICFLADKYKESIKIKLGLIVISLMIVFGGIAFQLVSMITPYSNFGKINTPFVAQLPTPSDLDSKVYDWIRTHTVNSARFFPYNPILMVETGRMSPGNYRTLFPEYKIPIYNDIVDTCGTGSINKLGLNYIILSPLGFSKEDYVKKCTTLNVTIVFDARDGLGYREIYEINK